MMREIKFRGKSKKTGEWLYGVLINNLFFNRESKEPVCYILDCTKIGDYDCFEDIVDYLDDLEVDSKTVGQFTGMSDINNKEIWEGDILLYDSHGRQPEETIIEYVNDMFHCKSTRLPNLSVGNWRLDTLCLYNKVTGNIHEGLS